VKDKKVKNQKLSTIQKSDKDSTELLKEYLNLLWGRKIWIIIITAVITLSWVFIYKLFLKEDQNYTSSAMIRFETSKSAVTDFATMEITGKLTILETRTFLKKVSDSLKLNIFLQTPGINRFELFKKIVFSDTAKLGEYRLSRVEDIINVFYSNKDEDIENKSILSTFIDLDYPVILDINGIELELDASILNKHSEIEFSYLSDRFVVGHLRTYLYGELDRSHTLLTIYYSDRNPESCAVITNTIVNLFVEQLLEFKKYRTSAVVKSFEEQLKVAHLEVKKSENALRQFREKNPYLFLSSSGSNLVRDLSKSEGSLNNLEGSISHLQSLTQQKNEMGFDYEDLTYQEILNYLNSLGVSGSNVLLGRYKNLSASRNSLLSENYSVEHPRIKDLENQISEVQSEVDEMVGQYTQYLNDRKGNLKGEIYRNRRNLLSLPREEIALAELQRDQNVKQQIYSHILVRFNEAKVSDATVVPDAFLVEEAEVPFTTINTMGKLKKLAMGPFLGLLFAIGLFILIDYLDPSVKAAEDVETKLSLPVLATLPVIGDEKEYPNFIDENTRVDQKLITSDYAPHIAGESFRLLRTKILMQERPESQTFIIASLNPGEGKSLVASNLAITFAQQKIATLILDCDLRRGVLHNSYSCNKKPGLTDILVGSNPISFQEVSNISQKTHIPNLFLISTGTQVPNPSEILGGPRMKELYQVFRQNFGAIVIDTPPIDFIPDALVLNTFMHSIIFVVRYGRTNMSRMSKKISEIADFKDDFKGVVINAASNLIVKKHDAYSYYKY
jgi:tyrosine-protein kinase Etk/Wzc